MNINEIKTEKQLLGWTNEDLAEKSGVPLGTVQKALGGTTKYPRKQTLKKLSDAIISAHNSAYNVHSVGADNNFAKTKYHFGREASDDHSACEEAFEYIAHDESDEQKKFPVKRQGEYTLEDYCLIPDEHRVELIDGVIYEMTAPGTAHQMITGEVYYQFRNFIDSGGGSCLPAILPIDVQLDRDNKTMVQPDMIVICDREKIQEKNLYGEPDFALEVLSPSTRIKDMVIKLNKYKDAGVREYWIADPDEEKVIVYDFENNRVPVIYTFNDEIPVAIFGGECVICLARVKQQIHDIIR